MLELREGCSVAELYLAAQRGSQLHGLALLEKIVSEKLDQPATVLEIGCPMLLANKVPAESIWTVREAVCSAATDLGLLGWVRFTLHDLLRKFNKSTRLMRLVMRVLDNSFWAPGRASGEKQRDLAAAVKLGHKMSGTSELQTRFALMRHLRNRRKVVTEVEGKKDEPKNKRELAIADGQSQTSQQVDDMLSAIDTFGHTQDFWVHCAGVYLDHANYSKAAFCLEEVMLHDCTNVASLIAYAEVQVGLKEYTTARKYFAHACMLDEKNPRALWGLLSINAQLLQHGGKGATKDPEDRATLVQLHKATLVKLREIYEPLAAKGAKHAKVMLASLKSMPVPTKESGEGEVRGK